MGYQLPAGDVPVSDDWAGHLNRNPPSSEPGTDYASAPGTTLRCADAGTVVDRKTSNSYATGRYVTVRLDDGRTVRYLHLQDVTVAVGQRVGRGSVLGHTGGSANGSDWGVGAHVHTTLWPGEAWAAPTIDFERYVGEEPPPPPEPEPEDLGGDMRLVRATNDEGGGVRFYTENGNVAVSNTRDRDLLYRFITNDPGDNVNDIPVFNNAELNIIRNYIHSADEGAATATSASVTLPWWAVGILAVVLLAEIVLGVLLGIFPR